MRLIFAIVMTLIGVFLLVTGINYYLTPKDELSKSDVVVAISGGDTQARTLKAVELYKEGFAPKILFSGAALDPLSPSNAKVMRDFALEAGVPMDDILLEETAQNTEENATNIQSVLDAEKYKQIILVTSPYHQRRAYLEFQDKLNNEVKILNQSSSDKGWPERWYLTPRGWWLGLGESVKTVLTAAKNLN
jgi:uncharacterized SAM-binding protein YcdF (DUF218 family)